MRRPSKVRRETRHRPALFGTAAVLLVAATLVPLEADRLPVHTAQVADLAAYPMLLAAAGLLYVHLRMTPDGATGWLVTAAVFGTAQGVGYAAVRVVMQEQVRERSGWLMVVEVAVAALMAALLAASGSRRVPPDPLLTGLWLAVLVTTGRVVLIEQSAPWTVSMDLRQVLAAALLGLYAVTSLLVLERVDLPRWATVRLALVLCLLGVTHVLTYPVPPDDWRSVLAALGEITGATLLAVTALRLVAAAPDRQARTDREIERLEGDAREDRALLHEVTSTVAGLSAASRLVTRPGGLRAGERDRLEQLMALEAARLERMLSRSVPGLMEDLDLDTLLGPVVLDHRIRGRSVVWVPTGLRVRTCGDDLVNVLDVLLDNAAVHSGSPVIEVTAAPCLDGVDLMVSDHGRGVPAGIAGAALEWGVHGPTSHGGGIGLSLASQLVARMGGRLTIESAPGSGTRVTVTLSDAAHHPEEVGHDAAVTG